jgi:hypothetical protein
MRSAEKAQRYFDYKPASPAFSVQLQVPSGTFFNLSNYNVGTSATSQNCPTPGNKLCKVVITLISGTLPSDADILAAIKTYYDANGNTMPTSLTVSGATLSVTYETKP